MNAVVKRPEVPCESQAPLLTLPARPLHTGTGGKRKWARRFPGSSPRAGGAGSRARGPGRPLNPLCRPAAPMAALLSSPHTGPSHRPSDPRPPRQPPTSGWAVRDRHSPSLPPRLPARGGAASPSSCAPAPAATHAPRCSAQRLPPLWCCHRPPAAVWSETATASICLQVLLCGTR